MAPAFHLEDAMTTTVRDLDARLTNHMELDAGCRDDNICRVATLQKTVRDLGVEVAGIDQTNPILEEIARLQEEEVRRARHNFMGCLQTAVNTTWDKLGMNRDGSGVSQGKSATEILDFATGGRFSQQLARARERQQTAAIERIVKLAMGPEEAKGT